MMRSMAFYDVAWSSTRKTWRPWAPGRYARTPSSTYSRKTSSYAR